MQERRVRIAYAAAGILLAILMSLALEAPMSFSLTKGFWLEILIWAVLAAFVVEPHFSGPPAALVNSVTVIFVALAARFAGPSGWWVTLAALAVVAVLLLIVDLLLKRPGSDAAAPSQRAARVARQVGVAIGSWKFILVASLALVLVTFNSAFDAAWITSIVVVLYVLTVARLQPHHLIAQLAGREALTDSGLASSRVLAPTELLVMGEGLDRLSPGDIVRVNGSQRIRDGIALSPAYERGQRAYRVFCRIWSRFFIALESPT